ncbi:hypothetical protein YC2023_121645 [Brassica napus]
MCGSKYKQPLKLHRQQPFKPLAKPTRDRLTSSTNPPAYSSPHPANVVVKSTKAHNNKGQNPALTKQRPLRSRRSQTFPLPHEPKPQNEIKERKLTSNLNPQKADRSHRPPLDLLADAPVKAERPPKPYSSAAERATGPNPSPGHHTYRMRVRQTRRQQRDETKAVDGETSGAGTRSHAPPDAGGKFD